MSALLTFFYHKYCWASLAEMHQDSTSIEDVASLPKWVKSCL